VDDELENAAQESRDSEIPSMSIDHRSARTLDEYVCTVRELRNSWVEKDGEYFDLWFRGVRSVAYKLLPSLYRSGLKKEEEDIRSEFERRGVQLVTGRIPRDAWEWYFLMQHHGAPTRLLDWTDSALVGLFFALNSNEPDDANPKSNAAVWVIDPWWLNRRVLRSSSVLLPDWEEVQKYLPPLFEQKYLRARLPVALDPTHIAARVAVQRSRFTIHGILQTGLEHVAESAGKGSRLVRIEIPRSRIVVIRKDLVTCGITDSAVFPDLEGLARELKRSAHAEGGD
jgi:hypothetical protein